MEGQEREEEGKEEDVIGHNASGHEAMSGGNSGRLQIMNYHHGVFIRQQWCLLYLVALWFGLPTCGKA